MKSNKKVPEDSLKTYGLQAIILADSFQTKFQPLSVEKPKALLNVVNCPMIDYTIKYLKSNFISEVIIYSANHYKTIDAYFKKMSTNNFKIKVVSSESCRSVCEALRDIHTGGYIHNDFVLIFGDVFANFNLENAFKEHMRRKREDKMNIMTKVFKKVGVHSISRTTNDDCVIVLDNTNNRVYQYESLRDGDDVEKYIDLNFERINLDKQKENLEVRYDLVDTDITFCTPEDFRDDFIYSLLTSEILEDRLFAYILNDKEYANKISDFRTYGIVSQHIIYRWLYPFCPDTHDLKLKEKNNLVYQNYNVYLDQKLSISHSSKISNGTVIGRETTIKEDCFVERSTIGSNCRIGNKCRISNSYIWDNVVIEDGSVIENSIVADGVVISKNTHINTGCVLGQNVATAEGAVIPANTLATNIQDQYNKSELFKTGGIFESEDFKLENYEFLGAKMDYYEQNAGFVDDEDDEGDSGEVCKNLDFVREKDGYKFRQFLKRITLTKQNIVCIAFKNDCIELLQDHISQNVNPETTAMEFNGTRLSHHATFTECINNSIPVILGLIKKKDTEDDKEMLQHMKDVINHWKPFITSIIKSEQDERVFLSEIENFCVDNERFQRCFPAFLQIVCYIERIINKGTVIDWNEDAKESEDPIIKQFVEASARTVEFLTDWDEDEEDEEDDDDEEEEEEDDDEDDQE